MNAMIVKAKQTAIMRPTNTMSPACCCSGATFARRFRKALVLDISFANCATTTAPSDYCYKYCAAKQVTPSHYASGAGGFICRSINASYSAGVIGRTTSSTCICTSSCGYIAIASSYVMLCPNCLRIRRL